MERKHSLLRLVLWTFMSLGLHVYSQSERTKFIPVAPEELSNSLVRCFLKDSKGYMWFGTNDGLIRYDGVNTYNYVHDPKNNKTISNNTINTIIEDSQHKLWIGTAQGLSNYNRQTDNFTNVDSIPTNKNHLNNGYITSLAFDGEDKLWIGTYGGGINIYDQKNSLFFYLGGFDIHNSPLAKNYATSVLYADGLIWFGTKGGLEVFDPKKKAEVTAKLFTESLPDKQITQLVQDIYGNIWFSTLGGDITKIKKSNSNYSFEKIISKDSSPQVRWSEILTMATDDKGNIWVGGQNSALSYFNTKTKKITYFDNKYKNPQSIQTNSIRSVFVDKNGLTWIGTFNKGAYLIDKNVGKFDSYQLGDFKQSDLEGKEIRGFVEDKKGDIWIACDGIGVIKLESKTNELKRCDDINSKLETKSITAMTFDKHGDIWFASWADGIYKVNLQTNKTIKYYLKSGGFGDNKTYFLYEDKEGTIWAGSNGSGLFYFDDKKEQFTLLTEKDKTDYITKTSYVSSMVEDSEGVLWVGTMYGLYKLTRTGKGSFNYKLYRQDAKYGNFSSNNIQYIYEDSSANIWFATTDNGLILKPKNSNEFKIFQKKDGLVSNTIRSILQDSIGNMWISSNMGISKLDLQTNKFTNYNKSDGLSSNNYNSSSSIVSSKGKIFFGSNNGFNAFYPDSVQTNLGRPLVYLTDLKINNKSMGITDTGSPLDKDISLTSSIKLNYNQRSFAIDFVAINYGETSPYEYCYMLEGFDKTWNCVGANHTATYTNIDPGEYVFLVKASNSDGMWTNTTEPLKIKIKQIWWKTWWAIFIYIIFIAGIIFFLFRIRMERVRMKNQLIMERLAREQEHELSESKTQFFTNISHEFRTPLSLISMPLESLSAMEGLPTSVKERISSIRSSSDKMLRLVNELMDFNKLENTKLKLQIQQGELVEFITNIAGTFNDISKKRNIHFGIHSMVGSLHGWFDHDKLDKILVNILSNAFKFTSDKGKINIIINSKEAMIIASGEKSRCLELSIVDNGIGISEKELPYIFDKFYQAKSSAAIANSGTGIGLSLTKGLVELHQGTIKVESKPNHETLFVILIPIDKEIYADDCICEISECIDTATKPISYMETEDAPDNNLYQEDESHDKPQILIVEDNDELRTYLALELREQFHVIEANNGQEGLDMALEISPDLIISDILMPIKNGIDLCKDIKTNLKTSHIPFVLLTARTTVDDQITGIETGADVYITKPFSIRFLIAQVNQIIESRQKLYSQFSKDVYLLPNKVAQNEMDQEFLQKAIDYIVENIQNPQLGVNSIADLFNLSRMQVYRKIKALTGKSVVNFIRMVRIKQALKLMDTQKYALAEIAYLTGFNSASYFTTSFKEEYGKAPSEYLDQNL
ncbi:hybrid sensor histidine kinase/response regulator transcription factor [Confluentibacter sediminis]|uniref:hybrid sensor histidine kinase/response regulator transcription factor n=1 Tax=Confluentibacter sediminis TaxID=2219045 RepID=UPI0013A6F659|nr:hybrid sensor histidine kinase/response regulator transcription factor [Confluentibacter sediminis]